MNTLQQSYQPHQAEQKNSGSIAVRKIHTASISQLVREYIAEIEQGKPFTLSHVLKNIQHANVKYANVQRATISKILSRFVHSELIDRVVQGVFVKPKINRFVGRVSPNISEVLHVIAEERHEIIQTHGAEAVRRFKLSTQMPTMPIYYTSGSSRQFKMGNLTIRLIHTDNESKLQHAGKKSGTALSALWYIGKKNTNLETIKHIHDGLSSDEFEQLCQSSKPKWMDETIYSYKQQYLH